MNFFHPQNIPEYLLYGYNDGVVPVSDEVATGEFEDDRKIDKKGRDKAGGDSEEFENDTEVLKSHALINSTTEKGFCEMHPLVQHCTQA